MKKLLKWGGIILVVIIIIGAVNGGKSGSNGSSTTQTGTGSKTEEAKAVAKVGETVQDGDMAFTATDVITVANSATNTPKRLLRVCFMSSP